MERYKRVIIKLSGEALGGADGGIDFDILDSTAAQIEKIQDCGIEVGVVLGGGNFWRGKAGKFIDMNTVSADHMGMLATAMNALAMKDALHRRRKRAEALSAADMPDFMDMYSMRRAETLLASGAVVVFACGTGNPFFTTDSAAALRAAELRADAVLLAKNVDGVYDKDPRQHMDAKRYACITYHKVIADRLEAADNTAMSICMNINAKMRLFALSEPDSIYRAARGEPIGTVISVGGPVTFA